MFPKSASIPAVRSCARAEPPRRYRHDPYRTRVLSLGPLPPACAADFSGGTSLSPSCAATDSASETASCELPPGPRAARAEHLVALVVFKYGAKEFRAGFPVEAGQAVVTEGDRGEDLGFVEHVEAIYTPLPRNMEKVIRVATKIDLHTHYARAQKEQQSLHTMRCLAKQVNCSACIQDIMYQLDGRKITVIISRDSRTYVDFRRLQRAAFEVFRCRVWCAYLDEISVRQVGTPKSFSSSQC